MTKRSGFSAIQDSSLSRAGVQESMYLRCDQKSTGVSASVTCVPLRPSHAEVHGCWREADLSSFLLPYGAVVSWARDEPFRR